MYFKGLQLVDFRNFERLQVPLRPRLNFFLGDNGQGKTNFLEAIYMLSRGSSFRPVDTGNFLRKTGSGFAKIQGRFANGDLDYSVEMTMSGGKKTTFLNGKRVNSTTLMHTIPSVLFSPESLAAIKEGPDQRRQLIDDLMISHRPQQGQLLREYSRALKARNRLLKNIATGVGPRNHHEAALDSLNKIFFLLATHLSFARIEALKAIQPYLREAMAFISSDMHGDISVDYLISDQSAMGWREEEIFNALRKRHLELSQQEATSGSSLVGPHKHDIKFLFAGNDSRFYCSQGQQRALILALKIAQIVYHQTVHQTYPVLLLDDVLSELDIKKRVCLMKFLEGISAQILITATDLTWSEQFGFDRNSIFSVTNGQIEPRSTV